MTFLNLQPVLNKKDQEAIARIELKPYNETYQDELETEIYEWVKAKRKQDALPALSYSEEKVDTYNQLAINKYKENSPMAGAISSGRGSTLAWGAVIKDLPTRATGTQTITRWPWSTLQGGEPIEFKTDPLEFRSRFSEEGEMLKKAAWAAASGFVWLLDVPLQQAAKATAGATSIVGAVAGNAEELVSSFKEDRPFDFLAWSEKFEETKANAEWFFGTKMEWGDYLDVRSSHEKRTELFNNMSVDKQEQLKPLENWSLGFDVIAGITSGLWAVKAPLALASRVGTATKLWKTMLSLDKSLAGVTKQVPKLGVAYWAAALAYYQQTGKWLFEWDTGATEGTAMFLTAAGLKGLGRAGSAGWELSKSGKKYISDLLADKEFQSGMNKYFDEAKNAFADEIDKVATKVGARTNLLADDKLLGEVNSARNGKRLEDFDFSKTNDISQLNKEIKAGLHDDLLENIQDVKNRSERNLLLWVKGVAKEVDEVVDVEAKAALKETQELIAERQASIRQDIPNKQFEEGMKQLATWLESSTVTSKGFMNKLVGEWLIKEGDSLWTWLSRAFKAKISGSFISNADEVLGEMLWDTGVSKFLNKADRRIAKKLEQTRASGKIWLVKQKFDKINQQLSAEEFKEFNSFLFAKSRYYKVRGKNTPTKLFDSAKNETIDISEDTLKTIANRLEPKYGAMADEIYSEYESLLQREFKAGIRTADDLANFKETNPFYIGDKTIDVEELLKTWPDRLDINLPKKNLAKGAEEALSNDSMRNAYNEMIYRNEVLNRVEKINIAKEAGFDSGLFKVVKEGDNIETGNIRFKSYEDGKLVEIQWPKFWVKDLFSDERITKLSPATWALTSIPRMMTRAFKETTTGKFNLKYQAIAPILETPPALLRMLAEGGLKKNGGRTEFFKTLFRTKGALDKTPATADAINDLASFMGATFTQTKQLARETEELFGKEFTRYSALKTKFKKGKDVGTKVLDAADVGNIIERKTTRLPLFNSQLSAQGLTKESLDKMVIKSKGSPSKLKELLEKDWINVESAAEVATSFFDYLWVTKASREIGQFIPYFNSAMSQAKSTKRLWESNPRMFMWMMGAGLALSKQIYDFNTNTPEKKTRYEQAPDYRKNVPMLYFGVNEEGEDVYMKLVRGVQFMEWSYPMFVQNKQKQEGNGVNFDDAFGKVIEDSIGVTLNPKEWGQYLPQGVKQGVEYATGFDFFKRESYEKTDAQQEFETKHYNDSTSNVALWLSRYIALNTWGKQGTDGVIRGGVQLSPTGIDKSFSTFDGWIIRWMLGNVFNNANQTGKIDASLMDKVIGQLKKTNKAWEFDDSIFDSKAKASVESEIRNNRINTQISEATAETMGDVIAELTQEYPTSKASIISKVKDRMKQDVVALKLNTKDPFRAGTTIEVSKMNNEQIAHVFIWIQTDKGAVEANKLIADLVKSWLLSGNRLRNVLEKIIQVQTSQLEK